MYLAQQIRSALKYAKVLVVRTSLRRVSQFFKTSLKSVLLLSVLPVCSGNLTAEIDPASGTNEFRNLLVHDLLNPIIDQTPGSAVVVVLDGEVILQGAYGLRRTGSQEPITSTTLFRIASLSKTIASAATAILIEEEPITWETPLITKLNDLQFKRDDYGARINLQHLMSQSTGLMPHAYTNLIEDNMPYRRIIERLDRVDFICPPGQCYGYQNVIFSLVGDFIEATTNISYSDYVSDRLFKPLNMTRASFGLKAFKGDANHADAHVRGRNAWRPVRTTPHYYRVPAAAGMNASIDDMREWLLAQLGKRPEVLPDSILSELHAGTTKTSRRQAHYRLHKGLDNIYYGLGWRVFDLGENKGFIHHGGHVRGMRSEMVVNPSLQMGLVFLTNSEPSNLGNLVFDFLDLYEKTFPARRVAHSAETESTVANSPASE